MKRVLLLPFLSVASALALPAVGPDYHRPEVSVPATYSAASATWTPAAPSDQSPRGAWWAVFKDPVLDRLEVDATAANEDLHAAAARVDEARAVAGVARSQFWPQIAVGPGVTREQTSSTTDIVFPDTLTTTYRAPVVAAWELDLFGRVRRLREGARAEADAATALFEATRLSLTAEVASTYFNLRAADRERALLQETVALRRRALSLAESRLRHGTAAEVDVARAQTELATAEADSAEVARRRATFQNALSVLVGKPPSDFAVAPSAGVILPPMVPAGLPAQLLERRPDIAAAERRLIAANARIGVAKAAFFPAISLTGSAGYASGDLTDLFRTDSRIWSLAPSLYLPIFQGGRNRANLDRSRAVFDETVANYRQGVLVAFREVEDALAAVHWFEEQSSATGRALDAARRAAILAEKRYNAGYVSYLEVIDAQRTALATERAAVALEASRLNASVALIKALGGGWGSIPVMAAR